MTPAAPRIRSIAPTPTSPTPTHDDELASAGATAAVIASALHELGREHCYPSDDALHSFCAPLVLRFRPSPTPANRHPLPRNSSSGGFQFLNDDSGGGRRRRIALQPLILFGSSEGGSGSGDYVPFCPPEYDEAFSTVCLRSAEPRMEEKAATGQGVCCVLFQHVRMTQPPSTTAEMLMMTTPTPTAASERALFDGGECVAFLHYIFHSYKSHRPTRVYVIRGKSGKMVTQASAGFF